MSYKGREIWLFLTEEARPGALYSVSGRSPPSRQRESVYYPEEKRVAIEPLDKAQKADALRHYNAMKFDGSLLVVSNGLHTEDIHKSRDRRPVALRRILHHWKPESDSYHTPRITGLVNYPLLYLAMVTENVVRSVRIKPGLGIAYGIATYSGEGIDPEPFDITRLLKQRMLPNVKIEGKTPEDIAEFFVTKVIDPEFFVCCVSSVWQEDEEEWKLAVRNLYS